MVVRDGVDPSTSGFSDRLPRSDRDYRAMSSSVRVLLHPCCRLAITGGTRGEISDRMCLFGFRLLFDAPEETSVVADLTVRAKVRFRGLPRLIPLLARTSEKNVRIRLA